MTSTFKVGYRMVASPLTEEMLAPLEPWTTHVQFASPLSDEDYCKLAEFLKGYPEIYLRVFFASNPLEDLEFLRFFPELRHFQVDLLDLKSLNGLRHLPENLNSLAIGETRKKSLSLEILERFKALETLHLNGHTKNLASIGRLSNLKALSLRSITLKDLSILLLLEKLQDLSLHLGGTNDLSLLPQIGKLKALEVWMVKGLSDLSVVSKLEHLQFLFLQALRNITILPDMKDLVNLKRVHLETMKGITDLKPIANAPGLEELFVLDCCQLKENDFTCLKGHPTLKKALIAVGSFRANQAIDNLLQLEKACRSGFTIS